MNELREAAERLRQQYANKADYVYCHKFPGHEMAIDIATVLSYALKQIQPDDNEPVTQEWLQEMKAYHKEKNDAAIVWRECLDRVGVCNLDFDLDISREPADKPITRGQVRLLLRALGQ